MKLRAKAVRKVAKKALQGRYWKAVLAAFIALLFGAITVTGSASNLFSGVEDFDELKNAITEEQAQAIVDETYGQESADLAQSLTDAANQEKKSVNNFVKKLPQGIVKSLAAMAAVLTAVSFVFAVLAPAIRLGYKRFNIALFTDKNAPAIDLLFSRMRLIGKALWLSILTALKVFVWSLLLFFPGIIAAYRYSQAQNILAENPDISAKEAIKRSKAMMKGEKWNLFCLRLSFIGWKMLSCLVPGIGKLLLTPYTQAAEAAWYLNRSGRMPAAKKEASAE